MFEELTISPEVLLVVVWAGMGLTFGRAFGKKLDQSITSTEWYKNQNPIVKQLIARSLDALHHWWMGGLLMLANPIDSIFYIHTYPVSLYWFGAGLLLDDLPDIPPRLMKYVSYLQPKTTE